MKLKKNRKTKKSSGGGYYTPCENCGSPKHDCNCFQDEEINNELDYNSDED